MNILAFFHNLRGYETAPIMERHGLASVGQNDWAPTSRFLDALNELAETTDLMSSLVAIGMEIGTTIPMPDGITLDQVYMGTNDVYQSLHRGADVGAITGEKVSDKHYIMTLTDVYPDDFTYGIMYGYARRFLPPGTGYSVAYDLDVKPRDRGGDSGKTVIHIKWD
jgi:hypothetical protein